MQKTGFFLCLFLILTTRVFAVEPPVFSGFGAVSYAETSKYKLDTQYATIEAGIVGTWSALDWLDLRLGVFNNPLPDDEQTEIEFFLLDFHQSAENSNVGFVYGKQQLPFGFENISRLFPTGRSSVLRLNQSSNWNQEKIWTSGTGSSLYFEQISNIHARIEMGKLERENDISPQVDYVQESVGLEAVKVSIPYLSVDLSRKQFRFRFDELTPKTTFKINKEHYTGAYALIPESSREYGEREVQYAISYQGFRYLKGRFRSTLERTRLYYQCNRSESARYYKMLAIYSKGKIDCIENTNDQYSIQLSYINSFQLHLGHSHLTNPGNTQDRSDTESWNTYLAYQKVFENGIFIKTEYRQNKGDYWLLYSENPEKLTGASKDEKYHVTALMLGYQF